MNWQHSGELGMVSEPYRVGKYFGSEGAKYGLFFNHERLGWFDTFEECQVAAEEHASLGEAFGVAGGETVGEVINDLGNRPPRDAVKET